MPVDPILQPLLGPTPDLPASLEDFDAWRKQATAEAEALTPQIAEPAPDVRSVRTVQLPTANGGTFDVVVYQPDLPGPHPLHLFLHGGGWVAGSAHLPVVDIACRERCHLAECVVVSVDYRKAPEHPFPAGLDDAATALEWALEHAADLGVDPTRITVGGQSAGANLAAALVLKLRDAGGPAMALQLLEVPALDLTLQQPSYTELDAGYGLETEDIRQLVAWYVQPPELVTDPRVSPLLADDLSGLPPAYVMSAEFDPVRDDGRLYAERLAEAGVPAVFSLQAGQIHASAALTKLSPAARAWRDEAMTALRRAHGLDAR